MKKVKLFDFGLKTLTVVLAVCISSCSLNEEPEFSLNTTNVFESQSSAETVLKQSYGWLAAPQVYGQFLHDVTPANGVYWAKTDAGRLERSVTYDYYAERQLLPDMWQGLYRAIAESNYLIDGLDNSGLSDDYKTRALAHARFVRGFAYFKLANLFGQAVVLTEPVSTANLESPLSDRDVVYQQAIDDLVFASENLLEEEMMDGLAVKNTAIAYLAKTYWMMASQTQGAGGDATQLYNTAKSYGDQVIDEYALELNYGDLWVNHISGSPESIFQLNFTLANGVQNRATFNFGPNGGWGFFAPGSPSWGNMRIDRAFYDYHRGTYPDDPRMEVNYFAAWTNQRNGSTVYSYPYVRYNDWSTGEPVEVI